MITLVTGTPGAGKTLYAMRFLLTYFYKYSFYQKLLIFFGFLKKEENPDSTVPIFCHGITGLVLKHEIVICDSKTCDFCRLLPDLPEGKQYKKVSDWVSFATAGSVFFIDECQHVYRAKNSASVSEFETHRHKGIDFYLITQHPMLIDADLRRLVNKHIHLVADFAGRKQYEWSECSQNLSVSKAVKSLYSLDKSLFSLYQSSTLHTKINRKVPFSVYLFAISVVVVFFLCYPLFVKYSKPAKPIESLATTPQAVKSVSSLPAKNETVTKSNQPNTQISSSQVSVFSDSDIELLPESSRWRLVDYRKFVDVGDSYEVQSDLTANTYYIEDGQRNRRAISSRRCKVIDNDVLCVIGGKLVASWTGQQQSQSSSVLASDTLSTQAISFLK